MARISIVRGTDWQGVYVDGKLVEEAHRVELVDVLNKLIGKKVSQVGSYELSLRQDNKLCDQGSLPEAEASLINW